MTTRWIHRALGALALAGIAGGAHAAWGHSDYAHVQAYRHLEASAIPRTEDAGVAKSGAFVHDPATIRAFDEDLSERSKPRTRKAKHSGQAPGPARS